MSTSISQAEKSRRAAAEEEKVDALERRIREKIEVDSGFADVSTQALRLERLFKSFDRDASGVINLEEFTAACLRLNLVAVQASVENLFARYDDDDSGFLSYKEFTEGLFGIAANPKADPVARGAVDRLRAKVLARGGRNGIRSLGKIFGQMDRNGNKRLDSEEVREALSLFGIPANPADIKIIMSAFDRDGDGSIDFEEFLRGMRGAMSKRRKRLVRKAFAVLDKTGDGEVTIDDLIGVYDVSKNPDVLAGRLTERQALEEFLSQWDKTDKDGVVTQAEFLEYYKDVSASIDDDDYFELMIRNAWHLSGGEGWSENTANKRVLITLSDGRQQVVEITNDLGIKKGDTAEMKKRLEAQGIKGIIAISENF